MVGAAYVIELVFGILHLVPTQHAAQVMAEGITWNYTTWLDLAGLALGAVLLWRFLSTGGPDMLKAMAKDPESEGHACHAHGGHGRHR